MALLLAAVGLLLASGTGALLAGPSRRRCALVGATGAVGACAIGIVPALGVLLGGTATSLRVPWDVPFGSLFVAIDALSAFFLVAIFIVVGTAALWGAEYWSDATVETPHGPAWFFFNLLAACMVIVVVARNGVLFLAAWEGMALASFFLVTLDDERREVRDAGRMYLVAAHLGTAFLLALFVLLTGGGGSMDFDRFAVRPEQANLLFLLALIGFGTKAGLVPLHVWLPEAHPAAPSHVSAVMSGVMIKTGIYGLLRVLAALGPPPAWWGWLLVAVGLVSSLHGVLFAIAQRDLKRLLAYSSVENIGIIALGIGLGIAGAAAGVPAVAALGLGGALFHVLNHACFKSLLFLGAGTVAHEAGTRDMNLLGGLLRRMPWTGATFLAGAIAIAALPPLNGFIGEWLIYLSALRGLTSPSQPLAATGAGIIGALALIGGLAAACFAMAFGISFLGKPRSGQAERAHDPGLAMRSALALLAVACALLAAIAPQVLNALVPVVATVTGLPQDLVAADLSGAAGPLRSLVFAGLGVIVAIGCVAGLRQRLLAGRSRAAGPTWGCGYANPTPRMQYTAASFVQPIAQVFAPLLRARRRFEPPAGFFPTGAALRNETPDVWSDRLYRPVSSGITRGVVAIRWLQHGRTNLYVLYIALTLVALLLWQLG